MTPKSSSRVFLLMLLIALISTLSSTFTTTNSPIAVDVSSPICSMFILTSAQTGGREEAESGEGGVVLTQNSANHTAIAWVSIDEGGREPKEDWTTERGKKERETGWKCDESLTAAGWCGSRWVRSSWSLVSEYVTKRSAFQSLDSPRSLPP